MIDFRDLIRHGRRHHYVGAHGHDGKPAKLHCELASGVEWPEHNEHAGIKQHVAEQVLQGMSSSRTTRVAQAANQGDQGLERRLGR